METVNNQIQTPQTQSSIGWGLSAFLLAWTGIIGLILSVIAIFKGLKTQTKNTANVIFGGLGALISLGAIGFQIIFLFALIFGSSSDDLGSLVTTTGEANDISYTMQLPSKFERETIDQESDRFIYRSTDSDIVRAIALVSCTKDSELASLSQSEVVDQLREFFDYLPDNTEMLTNLEDSFGSVSNISVGPAEDITYGRYAQKGLAVSLFADHPFNETMHGEMHMMSVDGGLCSGAWLGTNTVHEKNETKMDEALSSIVID